MQQFPKDTSSLVPSQFKGWDPTFDSHHFVQFYESDVFLLDSLSGFVATGLGNGDACIVVASDMHLDGLSDRLGSYGIDVEAVADTSQFVRLDAVTTLSQIFTDGSINAARFSEVVGDLVRRAATRFGRVRIFGEMVALLWKDGEVGSALRLEALWNDLHKEQSFSLFCAYPVGIKSQNVTEVGWEEVCSAHTRVIPGESYSTLTDSSERARTIVELQRKANRLEAEVADRKLAEASLVTMKEELELQVEDLRRLHHVGAILSNTFDAELALQGILSSVMHMHSTDLGIIALCDLERTGLTLKVQSGFDDVLKQIEWVPSGIDQSANLSPGARDAEGVDLVADPMLDPYSEVAQLLRVQSSHSAPLLTRNGDMIGILAVHFRQPHETTERENRLMALYARMTADFIENARLHDRLQKELDERKELLTREQLARAEAESANRMKDEFLATVSHELRTPLNAIIGWSHMLRLGGLDKVAIERALETIERNAKVQAQLIEDILDVSRVITGKLRLNIDLVDLSSVISAAIDSVQLAADSKSIQLEVTFDPSARHVLGDSNRLQQVVWNLLSNAIKFTPAGGKVFVQLEKSASNARINVIDSGEGISKEFIPYIFDRFRQADGTSTRSHGGLGLGLAIVRHLVEIHGGTISASSNGRGTGATFTLELPQAPPHQRFRGRRDTGSLLLNMDANTDMTAPSSIEGLKVLLVDDDDDTLGLLSAMLKEHGANVQTACSAREALDALEWYACDVIVSDIAMPDEDGCSLLQKIRARAAGVEVPAVALTAYVRVEDRERAVAAGFNAFVAKPVEPSDLLASVANLVKPGHWGLGTGGRGQ